MLLLLRSSVCPICTGIQKAVESRWRKQFCDISLLLCIHNPQRTIRKPLQRKGWTDSKTMHVTYLLEWSNGFCNRDFQTSVSVLNFPTISFASILFRSNQVYIFLKFIIQTRKKKSMCWASKNVEHTHTFLVKMCTPFSPILFNSAGDNSISIYILKCKSNDLWKNIIIEKKKKAGQKHEMVYRIRNAVHFIENTAFSSP